MAASRAFVCVRPQTYEDAQEAKILSYVFAGRSGLENTSFALLDPNGKKLTRGSRSPSMTYGTPGRLVDALEETATRYKGKVKALEALPTVRTLRLALNVAAADMRPLIVIRAEGEKAAAALAARVAKLAWSEDLVGVSHYVVLHEEESYEGLAPAPGVSIVHPDPYGIGGKLLGHADATAEDEALVKAIVDGIAAHEPKARRHDDHVREARRRGIEWESTLPVTDRDERRGKREGDNPRRRGDR